MRNAKAGVGRVPRSVRFIPTESKPEARALLTTSLLTLVSVERQILELGDNVLPIAFPIFKQDLGESSSLTLRLIPLVPNSLAKLKPLQTK